MCVGDENIKIVVWPAVVSLSVSPKKSAIVKKRHLRPELAGLIGQCDNVISPKRAAYRTGRIWLDLDFNSFWLDNTIIFF